MSLFEEFKDLDEITKKNWPLSFPPCLAKFNVFTSSHIVGPWNILKKHKFQEFRLHAPNPLRNFDAKILAALFGHFCHSENKTGNIVLTGRELLARCSYTISGPLMERLESTLKTLSETSLYSSKDNVVENNVTALLHVKKRENTYVISVDKTLLDTKMLFIDERVFSLPGETERIFLLWLSFRKWAKIREEQLPAILNLDPWKQQAAFKYTLARKMKSLANNFPLSETYEFKLLPTGKKQGNRFEIFFRKKTI